MLFLLILSILALESAHSIRFLYRHFLSGITTKSLNAFYYACSYAKVDCSGFTNVTACGRRRNQNWSSRLPWYIRSCLDFHSRKMWLSFMTAGIWSRIWFLSLKNMKTLIWLETQDPTLSFMTLPRLLQVTGADRQCCLLCDEVIAISRWKLFWFPR